MMMMTMMQLARARSRSTAVHLEQSGFAYVQTNACRLPHSDFIYAKFTQFFNLSVMSLLSYTYIFVSSSSINCMDCTATSSSPLIYSTDGKDRNAAKALLHIVYTASYHYCDAIRSSMCVVCKWKFSFCKD